MTTTETIKANLRCIRVVQNLTQEEAAFRCGTSTRHYSTTVCERKYYSENQVPS